MNSASRTVPTLVTAGVFDSRLVFPSVDVTANRRVSMFEIELPIGSSGVSFINGDSYEVSENAIICAKPGQIRHSKLPYKCYYIHAIVEDEYYAHTLAQLPDYINITDRSVYLNFFDKLIAATTNPNKENEILTQCLMLEIIYLLVKEASSVFHQTSEHNGNSSVIKSAVSYIDDHFSEDITLESIASHVHLSNIYFHNVFKSAVGKTPHRYLLEKRLSHAKKQLAISNCSFSEIASMCGFQSQSYFNYVFKREFGITPKQYRFEISLSWDK